MQPKLAVGILKLSPKSVFLVFMNKREHFENKTSITVKLMIVLLKQKKNRSTIRHNISLYPRCI